MHFLPKKTVQWCLTMLLLLIAAYCQAQTGNITLLKNTLDGSKQQLAKDSVVTVQDSVYFNSTLISKLDTPYYVKNIVTFRINEYAGVYLPAQFTATVKVRIIYTKPNLTIDSVEKDLSINYDINASYTNRSSFVFNNAHKVTVKVVSASIGTAPARVMSALVLDNEMQVSPVYKLSCTDDAVKSISANSIANIDSTDELTVVWPVVTGANVYDLEWAYVDSSAYLTNRYGNPVSAALLFRNNTSRVTITGNTYRIPLLYDNGGILFFRVRAVQEKSREARIETAWSSDYSGGLGSFPFGGHQRLMNWQSSIAYAEEGKRKAVVTYFDGSLRERQIVTKDNVTNKTVVGETFYDYQGRPVVEVMPAPSLNSVMRYTPKFNANTSGTEYDKSYYDKLSSPSAYLTGSASAMSNASGASQYYSGSNPDKNTGVNQFIPNAGQYPFTETEYTQDNTGRISRQSDVGPVFKLGSKHEKRYFYGTPGENDLDVLFGTDAGDRTHYFKNMVQDANGQIAVTYLDMYGRTIATALAGAPDSAAMDNLGSYSQFPVTDTLSRANSNVITDMVMESTQSQLVPIDGDYLFKYTLTPPVLQKRDCNNVLVCYNALYDLRITITDDAYNQRLGGKAFDTIIRNYTGAIVTDCAAPTPFDVTFTKRLTRGTYRISKQLSIRRDAMDYYRDSVFMKKNLCTTLDQFIQQQRDLLINTKCIPDCKSCQDSLGTWTTFRAKYMKGAGVAVADSAGYRGEAMAAYEEALAACDALCNKTSEVTDTRNAMLLDMSAPSGQYANPDDTLDIYSIFYQKDENTLPIYKRDTVTYLDEAGKRDLVYDELSNSYVIPQRLRPDQFAAKFKPTWAAALLKFHPEYCKWLEFQKHTASYTWDRAFAIVDTYAEAKAKGYLNPTGNSSFPFTIVTANRDPLSTESTANKTALEAKLNNFNGGSGANILSLWSMATITVKCPDNSSTCIDTYNTPAKAFNESTLCTADLDMAWRNFRQLYQNVKRGMLSDKIKNAACPAGVVNPTSAQLTSAGKQSNFNNAADALGQSGLGYLNNNPTGSAATDSTNKALAKVYEDNCNAYAKAWVQQLAPCKYSQTALNIIIPRLVQVCKEGSDVSHPLGSGSVKPGSTNTYKSFQEVLDAYNKQNGITNSWDCYPDMITAPAPYDKQVAYTNKPVYTKPDSCECAKLNSLKAEYVKYGKSTDSNFAGYLSRTRKISMTDADLTQLLNACNTTSSCTYFQQVINIPPALQCNSGEICVSCKVVEDLYQSYLSAYPDFTPQKTEPDTIQQKKNKVFANYMNIRLGFSKQAWEYLQFRDSCPKTPTPDTNICDSLTWAKNEFLRLFPSLTGDSLTLSRTLVGSIVTHVISTDNRPAWSGTEALAAAVWKDSSNSIFRLRDNLVIPIGSTANVLGVPYNARITRATIIMTGKQASPSIDFFKEIKSHYSTNGTAFGYLERALGPVIPGVTTFSTQPAVTTEHRITLTKLPAGASSGQQAFICTDLAIDMYDAYQKGKYYGLILRMDDATEAGASNNSYVFTYSPTSTVNTTVPWFSVNFKATVCDEWAVRFNYWFHTSYSPAQIDSMFLVNCGAVSGFCGGGSTTPTDPADTIVGPYDGPLLCGKSTPVFPPVDVNEINNCSDNEFFAISKGTELYKAYRDSVKGNFEKDYISTGLQAANKEVFTVNYNTSEYHYTLFYYDQAGNLVKTVPPAGVVTDRSDSWLNSVRAARKARQQRIPAHKKITQYRYNTLEQIVEQQSPDGGITRFWYDRLGRRVVSQNAQQKADRNYSYTSYDAIGRIVEVGQTNSTNVITDSISRDPQLLTQWLSAAKGTNTQITRTTYDVPYTPLSQLVLSARNLRNRVAWTATYNNNTDLGNGNYAAGTFYSYDAHGNVDTLLQDYKLGGMADAGNRFKKIVYRYDLISGKVRQVAYQPSQADAFYHRYTYDAENRLINVETSQDSVYWENDAYYTYYKHGPLARLVLGQQQVQGVDYAYTLQGWLKGVNTTSVGGSTDMGKDGLAGSAVARDAIGYSLYYYGIREYSPIGSQVSFAPIEGSGFKPLFGGNVAAISHHIPALGESLLSAYSYDVLNRLKGTQVLRGLNTSTNKWTPAAIQDFKEGITYDADGNILTYSRNGNNTFAGSPLAMDSLTYSYKAGRNQLDFIRDSVRSINYTGDIDGQTAGNYVYDSTGNLIKDSGGGISSITWTVYGKIATVTKTDGTTIAYTYDVSGNRISKTVNGVQTWYVRDASGNVMSVYTRGDNTANGGSLTQTEIPLYGSGRLGLSTLNINVQSVVSPDVVPVRGLGNGIGIGFLRGKKIFELSDHLGNILATVSDKKRGVSTDSTTVSYFTPDIFSTQEYYPFGMGMPGRGSNSERYRYGFNGKENDNDVKGTGNQQDYGMRIYDPRAGRFLSIDPLSAKYPELTPYQFASNTPLWAIDIDGLEGGIGTLRAWMALKDWLNSSSEFSTAMALSYLDQATIPADKKSYTYGEAFTALGGMMGYGMMEAAITPTMGTPGFIEMPVNVRVKVPVRTPQTPVVVQTSPHTPVLKPATTQTVAPVRTIAPTEMDVPVTTTTTTTNAGTSSQATQSGSANNRNAIDLSTLSKRELGNHLHYDRINGGPLRAGIATLPSELQNRYPLTQFYFARRGEKGPDVQVISGLHPSMYFGSKWTPGVNTADFKAGTTTSIIKFGKEITNGKLPVTTQALWYDQTTGRLIQ
ncbi:RHS repeat-associated core domain-containing protein [Chitinophaga filiformis]|uniref:RHS repeat-associated core domain-containing protein n=1 Tax=Chitinophaga filiformis TaxID=104663 RepID=A0A1G7LI24_CHIFI|nr:RHS repeat-associated core domain-containing protein [Chitinophaga filiformis]SDF49093.1 RHS repeat-associated core domain-containing protein [Chitinophaga filiformis]